MKDHDVPAVQRTEPAEAAEEGFPIADDGDHARLVAALAQRAMDEGFLGERDEDPYVLAERYLADHPDGDEESFLGWLSSERGGAATPGGSGGSRRDVARMFGAAHGGYLTGWIPRDDRRP